MMPALRIFFCMLFLFVVWAGAVIGFAHSAKQYTLDENIRADGIVVLTGGSHRVDYGLELLAKSRGKALFISGVSKDVPLVDILEKAPVTTRSLLSSLPVDTITLGRAATNTIGNAEESAEWVKGRGFHSVLLVTADFHMARALIEFRESMPEDVIIIPAPVATRELRDFSWVTDAEIRNLVLSEFHKMAVAKLRHLVVKNSGDE